MRADYMRDDVTIFDCAIWEGRFYRTADRPI